MSYNSYAPWKRYKKDTIVSNSFVCDYTERDLRLIQRPTAPPSQPTIGQPIIGQPIIGQPIVGQPVGLSGSNQAVAVSSPNGFKGLFWTPN